MTADNWRFLMKALCSNLDTHDRLVTDRNWHTTVHQVC